MSNFEYECGYSAGLRDMWQIIYEQYLVKNNGKMLDNIKKDDLIRFCRLLDDFLIGGNCGDMHLKMFAHTPHHDFVLHWDKDEKGKTYLKSIEFCKDEEETQKAIERIRNKQCL